MRCAACNALDENVEPAFERLDIMHNLFGLDYSKEDVFGSHMLQSEGPEDLDTLNQQLLMRLGRGVRLFVEQFLWFSSNSIDIKHVMCFSATRLMISALDGGINHERSMSRGLMKIHAHKIVVLDLHGRSWVVPCAGAQ